MQRLSWFRDAILGLADHHGTVVGLSLPIECRCGLTTEDPEEFSTHIADQIVAVIEQHFQIIEFDCSWQTVYGCQEPDCISQGIDRDLHQHQLGGLRVELREKGVRPIVGRDIPNGSASK